jgi:phosphatidylglycerol:prolipoprotein diacylglycerol transferase
VKWYGVFIAISFLICYFLAENLVKKYNLSEIHFNNIIFFILISGIIFARLYYVFLNRAYFAKHINEIPMIWLGGQTIHGGIFGAIIAIFLYSKIKNISPFIFLDLISVVAPLGQSIGRWGNFFNNEAFGKPAISSLIRLYIPEEYRPLRHINHEYFHPVFLYESVLNLLIFMFLYKKFDRWRKAKGTIFWMYLLFYSIIRFFLEFIRTDSLYVFRYFASGHVISFILIIIASLMLFNKERLKVYQS